MPITAVLPFLVAMGLANTYSEPSGAFACNMPDGWSAQKAELDTGQYLVEMTNPRVEIGPNVTVFFQQSAQTIDESSAQEVAETIINFFVQTLSADGQVLGMNKSRVKFDGRAATQVALKFKDEDGVTWEGRITGLCGSKTAYGIVAYAKSGDAAGQAAVKSVEDSFAVESRVPRKGGSSGGGLFTKESLASAAQQFKGGLKRDKPGAVIVAGDPPLTYGSVANFVTVIEILFDIQFTETEFMATRDRFVEYYNKADGEGKKILAMQGAELLKTLTSGSAEEREQSRSEGKAVFENAFKNGAAAGIGYAQVMWDAISRRSNSLAKAKAAPKKEEWDQEITEGDVDATIEMLYFMWIAAGRSADDVTPEVIMQLKSEIVQGIPTFDPQLQLVIANAQKVYAGMRQQWASATLEQKLTLSAGYGQALDALGLREGGGFEQVNGGGGGGGGGGGSDLAAIAQNTAWNSAKTWSTTSGG